MDVDAVADDTKDEPEEIYCLVLCSHHSVSCFLRGEQGMKIVRVWHISYFIKNNIDRLLQKGRTHKEMLFVTF